jgi:hypothetical protein
MNLSQMCSIILIRYNMNGKYAHAVGTNSWGVCNNACYHQGLPVSLNLPWQEFCIKPGEVNSGGIDMKKLTGTLMAFGIALMLLALNCEAAEPVQLSGTGGQTILAQVASTNITTQVTKASADDLWSWGTIPLGNVLSNGKLISTGDDGSTILAYPAFPTNTTPNFQVSNPMASSKYSATDLQNPDYNQDYWTMAQLTKRSVLY